MLVDANLLLFAVDETSPFHTRIATWMVEALNGSRRVGIPWESISAFLRISTHPRVFDAPLSPEDAWGFVADWLGCDVVWIPTPTERHAEVFGSLVVGQQLRGNLIGDAHLAALAIEHGITICSADSDFARFPEAQWVNPTHE